MKFLVTGGNGFIGSQVVRQLLAQGHRVVCLLRPTSRTHRLEGLTYDTCYGDIRTKQSLHQAMEGCDGVLHLASPSNWDEITDKPSDEIIVDGTRNVLEVAQEMGQLRCVYVSSATAINGTVKPVVQNENSPFTLQGKRYSYAIAKRRAEGICQEFVNNGLQIVIVNPGEVYGPEDTEHVTCDTLIYFLENNPVIVTRGGTCVAHVEDVAAGIIAAWERGRPGERYILGGENLTLKELATLTITIQGQSKQVITFPNALILAVAWLGVRFNLPLPFNPKVIPYGVRYWFMDNSKARHELGLKFRSAGEVLEPTLQWLVHCSDYH